MRVTVVPFGDIDPDVVDAAEPAWTRDDWHAVQRAFYDACRDEIAVLLGEPGWRLTDEEPMVVTWFTPGRVASARVSRGQLRCSSRCQYGQECVPGP